MKKLILDATSAITYISDTITDPDIKTRYGTLEDWKTINGQIYQQIIDEEKDPIKPKLDKILQQYKLLMTDIAYNKVSHLVFSFGTDREKSMLKELWKRVEVIASDPSEEFLDEEDSMSDFNISSFGTAHKLKIKLLTGNISLLKHVINDLEVDIDYIAHRSRCFVGQKYENKTEFT